MKEKLVSVLLASVMVFNLMACGSKTAEATKENAVKETTVRLH